MGRYLFIQPLWSDDAELGLCEARCTVSWAWRPILKAPEEGSEPPEPPPRNGARPTTVLDLTLPCKQAGPVQKTTIKPRQLLLRHLHVPTPKPAAASFQPANTTVAYRFYSSWQVVLLLPWGLSSTCTPQLGGLLQLLGGLDFSFTGSRWTNITLSCTGRFPYRRAGVRVQGGFLSFCKSISTANLTSS